MAGADGMTIEEVVRKVLLDERADVIAAPAVGAGAVGRGAAGLRLRRVDRRVDQLVESLGLRISKSEVSCVGEALDEHVEALRAPPLEGAAWASPRM